MDTMTVGDLLFISNDMYLQRPSPRVSALAAPLLAALRREQVWRRILTQDPALCARTMPSEHSI